jgi:sucrose-6-phosphate hydrolase SacC (GH32 family)
MSFNQLLTFPCELKLRSTPEGPRLTWTPVKELAALRGQAHIVAPCDLKTDGANPFANVAGELLEIHAELEPAADSVVEFEIRGLSIRYDTAKQELEVGGTRAPAPLLDGRLRLTVFTDRTMFTIFASDGLTYLPFPHIAREGERTLNLHTTRGTAKLGRAEVYELQSIWPEHGAEAVAR